MSSEAGFELAKRNAAREAVTHVREGSSLALGTGSTASLALRELSRRFPDGGKLSCVASSRSTEELARQLRIPVRSLEPDDRFDLMIDGADEVTPNLDLTKGGGGALFREKFLAGLSDQVTIVVDESKLVSALGTRSAIPVEVVPFARPVVSRRLSQMGMPNKLRTTGAGSTAWRSENGNEILDISPSSPVSDPQRLETELRSMPGIVETGLFLGVAHRVFVGEPAGSVREIVRR